MPSTIAGQETVGGWVSIRIEICRTGEMLPAPSTARYRTALLPSPCCVMSTEADALVVGAGKGTSTNGPAALNAYWNLTTATSSVAVMLSVTGLMRYQPLKFMAGDGDSVATFSVGAVVSA